MVRLEPRDHAAALGLYRASAARFPLIGAVLHDEQDGVVHVDDPGHPRRAYVEHAFGFAQVLGEPEAGFDLALERHLLIERRFDAAKVRLYTPRLPRFLEDPRHEPLRSWRQRFELHPASLREPPRASPGALVATVEAGNIDAVERAFGVARRFWRGPADFVARSGAVVVMRGGEPASLCYAAAQIEGEAEIDVLTRPAHRRLGLGTIAVVHFARRCFERGVAPLWDCFTNNAASMQLSRAIGFTPRGAEYPFFTIPR